MSELDHRFLWLFQLINGIVEVDIIVEVVRKPKNTTFAKDNSKSVQTWKQSISQW
jgi:hypothetical protein